MGEKHMFRNNRCQESKAERQLEIPRIGKSMLGKLIHTVYHLLVIPQDFFQEFSCAFSLLICKVILQWDHYYIYLDICMQKSQRVRKMFQSHSNKMNLVLNPDMWAPDPSHLITVAFNHLASGNGVSAIRHFFFFLYNLYFSYIFLKLHQISHDGIIVRSCPSYLIWETHSPNQDG